MAGKLHNMCNYHDLLDLNYLFDYSGIASLIHINYSHDEVQIKMVQSDHQPGDKYNSDLV